MVSLSVPFGFYRGNCFERVGFFLIPGFVSVNVPFELIARDKLWSLSHSFYKSVLCVYMGDRLSLSLYIYIYIYVYLCVCVCVYRIWH